MKLSIGLKCCKKCETVKLKSEFHDNKRNSDGKQSWCKDCIRENSKKANEEKKQARMSRAIGDLKHPDSIKLDTSKSIIKNLLVTIEAMCLKDNADFESLSSVISAVSFLKENK